MTPSNKPVTRKCATVPATHGVKGDLAVTIFRDTLTIKECGRRESTAVTFSLAALLVQGIRAKAFKIQMEKAKEKKRIREINKRSKR